MVEWRRRNASLPIYLAVALRAIDVASMFMARSIYALKSDYQNFVPTSLY